MRTPLTRLLLALATALALASCSGEDAPATDGTVIEITIQGDTIEPNGDRVQVPLGEPITFDITADREGELHVHATPEEEVAFGQGDTKTELTFDQPGVVDVEDHESGRVIVQLQVS